MKLGKKASKTKKSNLNAQDAERNEMTREENRWWKRFCKTMNEMPLGIELLVDAYGGVDVAERGATTKYFKKYGHVDNVPIINEKPCKVGNVVNVGTSL